MLKKIIFPIYFIQNFGVIDKNDAKILWKADKHRYLQKSKVLNEKSAFIEIVKMQRKNAKSMLEKSLNAIKKEWKLNNYFLNEFLKAWLSW